MFGLANLSLVLSLPKTKNQTSNSTFGGAILHQTFAACWTSSLLPLCNFKTDLVKDLVEKRQNFWKLQQHLSSFSIWIWVLFNTVYNWITNSFSNSNWRLQHQVNPPHRPQSLIFICFCKNKEYSLGSLHFSVISPTHKSSHISVASLLPTTTLIPFLHTYMLITQ